MDLLQLRYFQAVARHEHMSRAAEELRVAQPSLSRTIARLEDELGVPLFDRQGRRVQLNRFGTAFLRRVDRALGELDDARREVADLVGLEHGTVAIAAETLLSLPDLLARFHVEHPGVAVRLYQSTAPRMAEHLARRQVDMCVTSQRIAGDRLQSVDVVREEVLLGVPPTHPLANERRVSIDALAGEPIITTRPGYWHRELTDRLFAAEGLTPIIVMEGDELSAVQPLISAGLGIGLIPAMSRAGTYPTVALLSLTSPDSCRTLRLVWRKDAYLSAAARRFRDFVVQHSAILGT
ncbi:LysR family transcriptional regulator [Streptomyces sp. NPDC057199]|uniref:LysR family transcriptional regulator n=1 Tax=Streptomyces sp. NPDC057199 TaxID=3346047 RepID=UPI0036441891